MRKLAKREEMGLADFSITPIETTREILREDFFGLEAVNPVFDIWLSPEKSPEIHFSQEKLQRAKKLEQFLIPR